MASFLSDTARLLLVGTPISALGIAAEMARGSGAGLAVHEVDDEVFARIRAEQGELVMVDVELDVPEFLSRLRGDTQLSVAPGIVDGLIGRTVADVERALILQTLEHCGGNRTTASTILGISVRTMRNKLRSFIEDGIAVSPAH